LGQWRRTLPSNLALCVNPDFDYVRAKDPATGKVYVVAETRLASVPGAVPKAKKGAKDKKGAEPAKGWEVSLLPTQHPPSWEARHY
jgi:isoleucyl-tRNA synthetase